MLNDFVKYYDALLEQGLVPRFGYCRRRVSFVIDLDKDGNINDIVDIRTLPEGAETVGEPTSKKKSRKKAPKSIGVLYDVPDDLISSTSNVSPTFLWGKADYMFPGRKKGAFPLMQELHENLLSGVSGMEAEAVRRYFKNAAPVNLKDFEVSFDSDKENPYFMFSVEGKNLLDDVRFLAAWDARKLDGPVGYSCISGKRQVLRLVPQPRIRGVKGAQSSGCPLISRDSNTYAFNVRGGIIDTRKGMDIYRDGRSPIGWEDAFKYSTALNYLLDYNNNHCRYFGDLTVVFWSEGFKEFDGDVFDALTCSISVDTIHDDCIRNAFTAVRSGVLPDDSSAVPDVPFHIVGFLPNSGRILWAFDLVDSYGNFMVNANKYASDLGIEGRKSPVPLFRIPSLTVLEGQRIDNEKNLFRDLLMCVVQGKKFPRQLIHDICHRFTIKAASSVGTVSTEDWFGKKGKPYYTENVTPGREMGVVKVNFSGMNEWELSRSVVRYLSNEASLIKAILVRNFGKGDVIIMGLNVNHPSVAYQLGRLLAIAQLDIRSVGPKREEDRKNMVRVKDRWFRAMSLTPRKALKELFFSMQVHEVSNIRIAEIVANINTEDIPVRFSNEQGMEFFVGYYHQYIAFFQELREKKAAKEAREAAAKKAADEKAGDDSEVSAEDVSEAMADDVSETADD